MTDHCLMFIWFGVWGQTFLSFWIWLLSPEFSSYLPAPFSWLSNFFLNRLWVLLFKQSSWWWNLKKTSILKPLQWLHSPCVETILRSLRFCEESYQVLPSSVRTGIRMVVSPSLFQLRNNKCCMVFFPLFFLQSLKPWELNSYLTKPNHVDLLFEKMSHGWVSVIYPEVIFILSEQ